MGSGGRNRGERAVGSFSTIAAVTAAIYEIVQAALTEALPASTLRIGAPRAMEQEGSWACLYLHHLSPNASAGEANLPARRRGGAPAGMRVAVDLHYLVAFTAVEPLAAEMMLGKVLIALAARPVLDAGTLEASAHHFSLLAGLSLQSEPIRLIAEYPSAGELAEIWTGLRLPHRPSLQLAASPVLIDYDPTP